MKKTCGAGRGVHLFVKFMSMGISMRICHFFSFLIIFLNLIFIINITDKFHKWVINFIFISLMSIYFNM